MNSMFRPEVLDRAVKGLALVAHPVWMPLYINGLAWSAGLPALEAYPPQVFRWFTAAVALMAVVLPLLSLLWMKRVGMISSLEVPEAGQRRSPYTVQALCLGGLWWMLADLNLSPWLTRPLLSSLVLVLWALVWLERTKVSAHAMGMGALTAATACLYRQGANWGWEAIALGGWEASAVGGWSPSGWSPSAFLVPAAVLLSGLVVAGRLRSGAHTPAELLHGWGAGLLAMGLGLWGLGPTD
jgi:hypothetical protein